MTARPPRHPILPISAASALSAVWALFILILLWVSLNIPVFSGQRPEMGVVSHPRLFPYYYQTNADAPLELATSLGFPEYYRIQPMRVNRPIFYALIAGARAWVAEPLVAWAGGPRAGSQAWGAWTARGYLSTYALWILFNLALLLAAARAFFLLARAHFGSHTASLAVLLMLSSPITLLGLREIHLAMYHLALGVASLVFWHAVLLGVPAAGSGSPARSPGRTAMSSGRMPLRTGTLAWASLGMGMLFLGKLGVNVFGTGVLLALWMGQGRKLFLILPLAALPTGLWYLATRALGYAYGVSEVSDFGAGVWIFHVGSLSGLGHEMAAFLIAWGRCLGEDVSLAHLPFAALGAHGLWKKGGRTFLGVAALAAFSDAGFYFLVHRSHANYGMSTLLFHFIMVAEGLRSAAEGLASRGRLPAPERIRTAITVAAALAMQAALAWRQLPRYGG